MLSCETVLLHHSCPVCKYTTKEVREKYIEPIDHSFYRYRFKKELEGKKEFKRVMFEYRPFLICPECGTVLACSVCEKEQPYQE